MIIPSYNDNRIALISLSHQRFNKSGNLIYLAYGGSLQNPTV